LTAAGPKQQVGITVSRPAVVHHNPERPGSDCLAQRWRDLFAQTRKAHIVSIAHVGDTNRPARICARAAVMRPSRSSSGAAVTCPSSRRARCARRLDQAQSCAYTLRIMLAERFPAGRVLEAPMETSVRKLFERYERFFNAELGQSHRRCLKSADRAA
jgi:hypothetical protein